MTHVNESNSNRIKPLSSLWSHLHETPASSVNHVIIFQFVVSTKAVPTLSSCMLGKSLNYTGVFCLGFTFASATHTEPTVIWRTSALKGFSVMQIKPVRARVPAG